MNGYIGRRLKEALAENEMTARELSYATEIDLGTIYDYLRSDTLPRSDKLCIICEVLDVSIDWILERV